MRWLSSTRLRRHVCAACGLVDALRGWRVVGQRGGGTTRTNHQFTSAIGAHSSQDALRAAGTEGAFEGADPCRCGLRRQIGVAAFTVGSELKHENTFLYGELLARWLSECHPLSRPMRRIPISAGCRSTAQRGPAQCYAK